jgi:hypothetical protein
MSTPAWTGWAEAGPAGGTVAGTGGRGPEAELDGLRQWMRELGYGPAAIAAEFGRRYGIRPREGYRLAQGWSLEEAAERFNEHADQQDMDRQERLTGSRLAELERWPDTPETPPVQVLFALAEIYGADVLSLLDCADHQNLPQPDWRALLSRPRPRGRPGYGGQS